MRRDLAALFPSICTYYRSCQIKRTIVEIMSGRGGDTRTFLQIRQEKNGIDFFCLLSGESQTLATGFLLTVHLSYDVSRSKYVISIFSLFSRNIPTQLSNFSNNSLLQNIFDYCNAAFITVVKHNISKGRLILLQISRIFF